MMPRPNQLLIQAFREQLQPLEKRFGEVVKELTYAVPARVVQLELERNDLVQKIGEVQQRIASLEREERDAATQDLIEMLTAEYETVISETTIVGSQIMIAYQRALKPRAIVQKKTHVKAIVQDLAGRIQGEAPFSWLHRFVGHLLELELPLPLLSALRNWAETYIVAAETLQHEIRWELASLEECKDCLLIRIRRSNQESTKRKSDRYYIDAWFIEDVHVYRTAPPTGAKPIYLAADSETSGQATEALKAPGQVYSRDEIEDTIRRLRQRCFELYQAERPLIQVFLPLKLMNLEIDNWALQKGRMRRRFGTHHEVIVRSGDRLDPREFDLKQEWQNKWRDIENQFPQIAVDVFRNGDPNNIDALYGLGQLPEVLGIKLILSLANLAEENCLELFQTLILDSGIPLAFWMRQSADGVDCCSELRNVLQACCLERLPDSVRRKRLEVFDVEERQRDDHIGNHLSLLWDDPKILPPGSSDAV